MVKYRKISKVARLIFVLILCLTMLFFCVAPGFAVVASAGVIVPVVLAAMGAFGVGTLVNGMSASEITSWVSSELESWAASLSDTVDHLIPLSGITTNPLGSLVLLPSTVLKVVTFVRWLLAKHNVVAGGSQQVVYSVSGFSPCPVVSNLNNASVVRSANYSVCKYYTTGDIFAAADRADIYIYAYPYAGRLALVCVSATYGGGAAVTNDSSWSFTYKGLVSSSYVSGGRTVYYGSITDNAYMSNPSVPYFSTFEGGLDAFASFIQTGPSSLTLVPEGAIDYPDYAGDDDEEMPYVVDWGGVPGMTVDDAADEIMDRVTDNDLITDGSVALDPDNTTWPDLVSPPQVPGLDDVFPFCVPFDVYHFFQALVAAPEAI